MSNQLRDLLSNSSQLPPDEARQRFHEAATRPRRLKGLDIAGAVIRKVIASEDTYPAVFSYSEADNTTNEGLDGFLSFFHVATPEKLPNSPILVGLGLTAFVKTVTEPAGHSDPSLSVYVDSYPAIEVNFALDPRLIGPQE